MPILPAIQRRKGMQQMNIEIKDVNMIYPNGKKALSGVSLDMESPSLIGLVGPNGAGKSTLMKLITTRLLQTGGSICVDGLPLEKDETRIKDRLGYLPQDFGLYDELTVLQFLEYIAALKKLGGKSRSCIDHAIQDANLQGKRNTRIGTLSGGQRQRVGIAQALMGYPDVIILDEPTMGLDPEERVNFRNLFSKNASGKIVILSTHIIEDVQSICNRLIVINQGVILFDGKPSDLILAAGGHVGIFETRNITLQPAGNGIKVTSRVFTARGIQYRIVSDHLPEYAASVEPSLEDAYIYLMSKGN
jgi:ABC-2 type transport system ATP-binding protein